MESKLIFAVLSAFVITLTSADTLTSRTLDILTAKIEQLEKRDVEFDQKTMELEQKNLELEVKNSELEAKVSKLESGTSLAFDCYRTEDWSTDGIITFNGCAGIGFSAPIQTQIIEGCAKKTKHCCRMKWQNEGQLI